MRLLAPILPDPLWQSSRPMQRQVRCPLADQIRSTAATPGPFDPCSTGTRERSIGAVETPRRVSPSDMVGLAAAAAVLHGVVLPWTTATYLDDIKTRAGSTSPAVIETGVAGLVVLVVAGAHIAGRLGGFATAVASCLAAGVVLMGVIDVLSISASTADGGGPLHLVCRAAVAGCARRRGQHGPARALDDRTIPLPSPVMGEADGTLGKGVIRTGPPVRCGGPALPPHT